MKTFSNEISFNGVKLNFHRVNGQAMVELINGKIRFALLSWENSMDAAAGKAPKKVSTIEIKDIVIGNIVDQIGEYVSDNIETIINPKGI